VSTFTLIAIAYTVLLSWLLALFEGLAWMGWTALGKLLEVLRRFL